MRRFVKRMAAVLLASACLLGLWGCSASQAEDGAQAPAIGTNGTPVEDAMAQSLILSAAQTLAASDEQLIIQKHLAEAQGDAVSAEIYQSQLDARMEMGGLKAVDLEEASAVLLEDGSYTIIIPVTFDEGEMLYLMNLNMATQEIRAQFADSSAMDTEDSSISGLLQSASVNTAVGMGTVFVVLIFISLIIYCFKYLHQWEEGKKGAEAKKASASASAPAKSAPAAVLSSAAAAPAGDMDEELAAVMAAAIAASEDEDLVAVITAAIAAYEGTSSNGLVVRSIRRADRGGRR